VRFGAREIVVLALRPEKRRHILNHGEARLEERGRERLPGIRAHLRNVRSRWPNGRRHGLPAPYSNTFAQLGSRALKSADFVLRQHI
jgi:hypothetical protein